MYNVESDLIQHCVKSVQHQNRCFSTLIPISIHSRRDEYNSCMYYIGTVIQGMQKKNLQKQRFAHKEWLQFTVELQSKNSCKKETQRTIEAHFLDLFQCHYWYLPLLCGYCCKKCSYRAVIMFFIKCHLLDLHFSNRLQTCFFPRWAVERIGASQVLWHVENPLHFF